MSEAAAPDTSRILSILQQACEKDCSDVFLIPGLPVTYKVRGHQDRVGDRIFDSDTRELTEEIYALSKRPRTLHYEKGEDDDFSFAVRDLSRFRVNIFRQRGSLAAVIRVIKRTLPDPEELRIPESVLSLADSPRGLVLVTGAAGSGKSTTLACMIDRINRTRDCHVITMEDPIEYMHRHNRAIVSQREIFADSPSYLDALRSALRESPDVLLLGEMRDYDTISAAITAAETGILLFSTLHTVSASATIGRIVDVFPSGAKEQVKLQLSQLLRGIVCQQLVPTVDGGLVPAFEIMKTVPAIQNMIREDKYHQLDNVISAGAADGMCTMNDALIRLYKAGTITKETAFAYSTNYDGMVRKLGR